MHCHSCEVLLSDAIGELPGVKSVKANEKTKKIDVEFEAPAIEQQIVKAIEKEGYKVS
jgi:copper chaperone CopZ